MAKILTNMMVYSLIDFFTLGTYFANTETKPMKLTEI
jgi:hypothetical protein